VDNQQDLIIQLKQAVPQAVLKVQPFGHSEMTSVWIEGHSLLSVATFLKNTALFKLDWLENLCVVEFEKVFVMTYFIRSTATHYHLVLRISVPTVELDRTIEFPSIRTIWPMGVMIENEISELFGILFQEPLHQSAQNEKNLAHLLLPKLGMKSWEGFPLRKQYGIHVTHQT